MAAATQSIFLKSKEEALPHVLEWLGRTYCEQQGSMLLKKEVHDAYEDFCTANRFEKTTNAAFGKMFKRVFPSAEVRRLVKHNQTTFFYENMTSSESSSTRSAEASTSQGSPLVSASELSAAAPGSSATTAGQPAQQLRTRDHKLSSSGSPQQQWRTRSTPTTTTTTTTASPSSSSSSSGGDTRKRSTRDSEDESRANKARPEPTPETQTSRELRPTNNNFQQQQRAALSEEREAARVSPSGVGEIGFADTLYHITQLYLTEMWSFCPVNPAMLDYNTLSFALKTEAGTAERSALSVTANFVASIGYLLMGDVEHGREFYNRARECLSYVFDSSNYDVACVLRHMAWASVLFSPSQQEGLDREAYYLSLSRDICQALGSNDVMLLGTLKKLVIRDRADTNGQSARAIRDQPFRLEWNVPESMGRQVQFSELYHRGLLDRYKNIVLLTDVMRQGPPQSSQIIQGLIFELHQLRQYDETFFALFQGKPPPRTCAMHIACMLLFRAIVYNYLDQRAEALQHFRELVHHFSISDPTSVAIVISEFASRGIFSREVIGVLIVHQLHEQILLLQRAMQPLRPHFYWIDAEMTYLERATNFNSQGSRIASETPILPPPHSSRLLPPLPYPFPTAAPLSQLPDFHLDTLHERPPE